MFRDPMGDEVLAPTRIGPADRVCQNTTAELDGLQRLSVHYNPLRLRSDVLHDTLAPRTAEVNRPERLTRVSIASRVHLT